LLSGDLTGLRGVDLGVRDVAAQVRFYTDVWRLTVAAERGGSVYLRGSGAYCHILALHPRSEPALLSINLAAPDRAAVDRLRARVAAAGAPQIGPAAPLAEPGGGYGFAFLDPEGRSVRVIAEDARHADAGLRPDQPERITHVVLNAPRPDDAAAFWTTALGFEVSDRSQLTFIRCNDDHHNIAFHRGDASSLHHIAFEMDSFDSVMRGAGRMRDAGRPIEWGPGRHGPGNNVFAYFIAPDDFVIEYTAEVEKVAENRRIRAPEEWSYPPGHSDLWGVTPPPSARMKAAQQKIRFAAGLFHP
jgi:catechol 2,3-dioxygenase